MTDHDQFEPLRRALRATSSERDEPTPTCLNENTIAGLADGTLDPAARAAALPHLSQCARCRVAVASIARALSDVTVSREIGAALHPVRRRLYRVALPLAAAAVLIVLALPRRIDDPTLMHRAPTITAAPTPSPVSPLGTVAEARALQWAAVAGADRYRVTLFDAGSRVLYATELADTVADLPDSIVITPGQLYLWRVEARTGFDRWAASPLAQFRVGAEPR